jgi:rhodanese-related sulfurtransferase
VDAGAPVQIVDVRGLREYDAGHIVGSRFIPRGTLEDRASLLADDRGVTIVTYCDDGSRAIGAARTVRELRPEHRVVWLDGGLPEWRRAGGAVEPGVDGTGLTADHVREDVSATDLGSARTSIAQGGGFSAAFMQRYLEWEEKLGEKYRQHRPVA